jgi:hypothetical protein
MLPSGSDPGTSVASSDLSGSPAKPSYLAGTSTALVPAELGVVPPLGGRPSSQKV